VNEKHVSNTDYGFDWSTSGSTGVIVPFAVGLQTTFANSRLPRRYEIGGWYDSSTYTDPLLAANGSFAAVTGQPYATQRGRSGGFVRFEQMVWRPDPASERGLTVFGVAMTGTSGQLTQDRFLELGFVLRGTFRDRDDDTIGFVINQQSYSGIQMLNWTLARAAAGGTGTPFSSQIMTELSYGIQLGRNIRVQPNVQYIIHPDQSNQPARLNNLPNAFVIGLRFDVDLVGLAR
jgi:porin